MKLPILLFSSLFTVLIMAGCYYDNNEELYPQKSACDTNQVTYSQTIAPVMVEKCNTCHNNATASGGIITDNYTGLANVANTGKLWGAVSQSQGFSPMPKGGKLSDCNQNQVKKWIDNGVPNN